MRHVKVYFPMAAHPLIIGDPGAAELTIITALGYKVPDRAARQRVTYGEGDRK